VIGGIAAILHGVPRTTFDLDILIEATPENAEKLLAALGDASLGTAAMTDAADILAHEITVFEDRVRIDVQTSTPGLEYSVARTHRVPMTFRGVEFFVVSRADLIASKLAAGRAIDLQDVELLGPDIESDEPKQGR
jgi:hypothetical protein